MEKTTFDSKREFFGKFEKNFVSKNALNSEN